VFAGIVALTFEEMNSTVGSFKGAEKLVNPSRAKEVQVAATHGVFRGSRVSSLPTRSLNGKQVDKVRVLTVAPRLAEALKRVHHDHSNWRSIS